MNRLVDAFFVIFIGLTGATAKADVLFLDMNNSPLEIAAAKRGAAARGEKLVVIPDTTQLKSDLAFKSIQNEYLAANKKLMDCTPNACEQAFEVFQKANEAYVDYLDKAKVYLNQKNLNSYLNQLKNQNITISSVIISGHDGNGKLHGTFGEINEKEFQKAFKDNEPIGQTVRSLLLWGCYTSNLNSSFFIWNNTLPHIEMIAGFEKIGPSNLQSSNFKYLESVMKAEKQLVEIHDVQNLKQQFKRLASVNVLSASVCVRDLYVSHSLTTTKAELDKQCLPLSKLNEIETETECYIKALPGCTDIPENTSSSALRTLYNRIQDVSHCADYYTDFNAKPDEILRLIYYKQVVKNFSQLHKNEINSYLKRLIQFGAPAELTQIDFSRMARKDIINWLSNTDKFFSNFTNSSTELSQLTAGLSVLREVLGEANSYYTPTTWIEPHAKNISTTFKGQFDQELNRK